MEPQIVDVVVRCKNEMPHVERAIEALLRQRDVRARVLFLDDGSTDGSVEVAERFGVRTLEREPGPYVPGAVLNRGMRATSSPVVAFVNADAIPQADDALVRLVAPFDRDPALGATFGRQLPRPGADPLVRAEYARAFGPTRPVAVRNGRFFSMAASAIRRSVWEQYPFDETLSYSEDVDWTTRILREGHEVLYVPEAEFEHSHDYDLRGLVKRRRGEGAADRRIHALGPPSLVTDFARPLVGALVRDARSGLLGRHALAIRLAQAGGYYAGRRHGGAS
jgi:rhamnosyltransferase